MKKKLIFLAIVIIAFMTLMAISVSAAALNNYASVKLTLVDGTETTGYCVVDGRFQRDNVYKNPEDTDEGTYAWEDIKVFDMRDSVIVGTKTYNEVAGLNCNSQAVNVEEFYFSSQVTKILNTSFSSEWKSLKTVYIPKAVTYIACAFKDSPIREVILEEGSQLKTIEASAFQGCTNLTTFDFPEGLESLGRNCFWQSGLSGTIVIPNSATKLDAGSLLSTNIENLYLGDGELEIGYNFLGTYGRTDNAYLKNVYISASTTFTATNIFYKCANLVNFYIVGTDEECATMVNTLKSHSTGNYMTFITESEAEELGINEENGAGYAIIHTGYNTCDAFYNSKHNYEGTGNCLDGVECTQCKDKIESFTQHNMEETLVYDSLLSTGKYNKYCTNASNCVVDRIKDEVSPAIFIAGSGFSTKGDDGIANGYVINVDALNEYNRLNDDITFGIMVINPNYLDGKESFFVNGNVNAEKGFIKADMSDVRYNNVSISVTGFVGSAENMSLVIALYAYTSVDNVEFLQSQTTKCAHANVTLGTERLYTVNLNSVKSANSDLSSLGEYIMPSQKEQE
ncbi:MAG: hypothetical protein E7622_02420 [Ruminococcaceae bacterium]|nr:hypothetical protein [Oscillospiraceae bacterium]